MSLVNQLISIIAAVCHLRQLLTLLNPIICFTHPLNQ